MTDFFVDIHTNIILRQKDGHIEHFVNVYK